MPRVHLQSLESMSNSSYHAAGKPTWWLRSEEGVGFITIARVRGDETFRTDIDLPAGVYVLGVGKRGAKGALRQTFVVQPEGAIVSVVSSEAR